jgi:NAD(P)H-hydrate epimerase
MREVDRIATEETGPNLLQMMENAGRNAALQVIDDLGDGWTRAEIVVLAGPGGNGGGGICAARHLANRRARVTLVLSDPARLSDASRFQHQVYESTPGREVRFEDLDSAAVDIIVDAVIGYGLRGAPRGMAAEMIAWANDSPAQSLALDVPSGVDATTGEAPGIAVGATTTLTLALPKTGLVPERTGALVLADIGIPGAVYAKVGIDYASPFDHRFRVPVTPA